MGSGLATGPITLLKVSPHRPCSPDSVSPADWERAFDHSATSPCRQNCLSGKPRTHRLSNVSWLCFGADRLAKGQSAPTLLPVSMPQRRTGPPRKEVHLTDGHSRGKAEFGAYFPLSAGASGPCPAFSLWIRS
jgi:hypothetical protein